jgi:hypothetical protein
LDFVHWAFARIGTAGSRQPTDGAHRHVVIAENLATEPNPSRPFGRQCRNLRGRPARRLSSNEFDSARGASRVAATGMQLIDVGFVFQSQHEPFPLRNGKRSDSLDGQVGHSGIPHLL